METLVSAEDKERVREKLFQSEQYILNLIPKELGVFPFKHFLSGYNYALVEDDKAIIDGSGFGKRNVWAYVSKTFRILLSGKLSASLCVEVKGLVKRSEFNDSGLYELYSDLYLKKEENNCFYWKHERVTDMYQIKINSELGFDKLLNGDLDSAILSVLRISLDRYKSELHENSDL